MPDASQISLSAMGIGVSDLVRSVDFYTRVIGMVELFPLHLPDMDEVILGFPGHSAALVLMHWTDGSDRDYAGNPVKVVLNVPDAAALADAIRAEGLPIDREAEALPSLGNAVIAMAQDPDGYVIELLQAAAPA